MSSRDAFLAEDEGFFGPGTDLAISLAAILILVVSIRAHIDNREKHAQLEIESILRNQVRLVDAIASYYRTQKRVLGHESGSEKGDLYGIFIPGSIDSLVPDITFRNDATLQRISFGSHILFEPDEVRLLPQGESILRELGQVLHGEIETIQEIHIQGHADLRRSTKYNSNLELAARRSMTVYLALKDAGINPVHTIMSAASFGEYVPVKRDVTARDYSADRLTQDNDSPHDQLLNRRIEILLNYRRGG
jgi:flagellar motor protein MotB